MCNAKTNNRTMNVKTKEDAKKITGDGFKNFAEKKAKDPNATRSIKKNQKGFTVQL